MPFETVVFFGNIIHCTQPYRVDVIENGYVIVKAEKIISIGRSDELNNYKKKYDLENIKEIHLKSNQLLLPGLIDTHCHAPQFPNCGLGYDKELLDWLQTYTFPLESKYKDTEFAQKVYETVVQKCLSSGTTTVCYFATIHLKSSLILADAAIKFGQRAFVGKVNMTKLAPPELMETTEETIQNTIKFIEGISQKQSNLVQPIITPRFSLSLNMKEMEKLGEIAKKYDLNIQSHISENKDEVDMVEKEFGTSYAEVYDKANLLTTKTVLAHGIFLKDSEIELLKKRGTSISHCPNSNTSIRSGLCNIKRILKSGLKLGLGTDVSAGYSHSMLDAMRSAVQVSNHLCLQNENSETIDVYEAFYLATIGGAKALAIDHKIGNFEVGKEFDAIIVEIFDTFQDYCPLELLQKFIFTGDDRNVINVYISGKKVK